MQVTFARLLGGLALVYAVILQRGALPWTSDAVWGVFTGLWLISALALIAGRAQRVFSTLLAILCVLFLLGPGSHLTEATALLWWHSISVAVTVDRPRERALLVRTTVTVVYAAAALAKLNPSFLAGEQIAALAADRSQLSWAAGTATSNWTIVLAVATIAAEASLALALWIPRVRRFAAFAGIVMHLAFVLAAHTGTRWDIAHVIVLNFALVAGYLAFFHPIAWRETDDLTGVTG